MRLSNLRSEPILFSGVRGDTRRYRIFHLYQQFRLAGQPATLSDLTDPAILRRALTSDLVVIHRAAFDKTVASVMQSVRANGGLVLADTDDLIFDHAAFDWIDSPDFADPVRERLYRQTMERQRQTLLAADAVLVSTDYLAQAVRNLGKKVWVHRNAFSLELAQLSEQAYQQRRKNPSRVVIGYASGTLTHNRDFALVKPALKTILRRYPQAELHLIGAISSDEDWGEAAERVQHLPLVPWRDLPALLARLDINLAPLVTGNPFAQSKSEIKYMEAGLVGTVTIASPTDAYCYAIHSGKNGMLAESEAGWVENLEKLVRDASLREAMAETARQDILLNYSPQVRAGQLMQTVNEIFVHAGRDALKLSGPAELVLELCSIPVSAEQHPTLVEMGLYYLRMGEPLRLAGMIWVQIRRLFAPVFPFRNKKGE
jgi:glycosyltransferase involved in cell wall biosynthesis